MVETTTSIAVANRKTAFITGITGQDGSYLAEFLLAKGYKVWGLARASSSPEKSPIRHLLPDESRRESHLHLITGNLEDSASLSAALETTQPDEIYCLGSQSHVQVSFEHPELTANVTGLGIVRILEAIRSLKLPAKCFNASTAEIFGNAAGPLTEMTPIQPRNPYGAAKAYAFFMAKIYRETYGLFATNGILFNHESPRRGENFVTRKITRAVGRILTGQQQVLSLGNLNTQRDWGFAGDYAVGFWQTLQAHIPRDYVLSSGQPNSLRRFCEIAFASAGMPITWRGDGVDEEGVAADGRVLINVNPRYFRPESNVAAFGDCKKARQEINWTPETSFASLVQMMVEHDIDLAHQETAVK